MKKMRTAYAILAVSLILLLSTSLVNAQTEISVAVLSPVINPSESQVITATTNAAGVGVLLVLQPAIGDPWIGFMIEHPELAALFTSLPDEIKLPIMEMIGDKIVSYKFIMMIEGGSQDVWFPTEFTGINGLPSTELPGIYEVIFVFVSAGGLVDGDQTTGDLTAAFLPEIPIEMVGLVELDFACGGWFVVPEVPLGTIAPILAGLGSIPVAKLYKRKHA